MDFDAPCACRVAITMALRSTPAWLRRMMVCRNFKRQTDRWSMKTFSMILVSEFFYCRGFLSQERFPVQTIARFNLPRLAQDDSAATRSTTSTPRQRRCSSLRRSVVSLRSAFQRWEKRLSTKAHNDRIELYSVFFVLFFNMGYGETTYVSIGVAYVTRPCSDKRVCSPGSSIGTTVNIFQVFSKNGELNSASGSSRFALSFKLICK